MRLHDYAPRPAHLKWLLDCDPAIRWQVMRDLTAAEPDAIAAERSPIATEGWGAQLLTCQSPAADWGPGPRGWRDELPRDDRALLITLYAMVVLMDFGLDPASKQARRMIDRVDKRLVFKRLNNRPFLDGETEPCINGRILGVGSYFKEPNDALADQLLGEQIGAEQCRRRCSLDPEARRTYSAGPARKCRIPYLPGECCMPASRRRAQLEWLRIRPPPERERTMPTTRWLQPPGLGARNSAVDLAFCLSVASSHSNAPSRNLLDSAELSVGLGRTYGSHPSLAIRKERPE
jgi:hypothetical protein